MRRAPSQHAFRRNEQLADAQLSPVWSTPLLPAANSLPVVSSCSCPKHLDVSAYAFSLAKEKNLLSPFSTWPRQQVVCSLHISSSASPEMRREILQGHWLSPARPQACLLLQKTRVASPGQAPRAQWPQGAQRLFHHCRMLSAIVFCPLLRTLPWHALS